MTKVTDLRLGRVVGVGAFGVVRVGRHRWSGARYAVKLIPRRFIEAKQLWRHTRREAAALAAVSSPFVLRGYCAQVDLHAVYIVTDLLPGLDLHRMLNTVCTSGGGAGVGDSSGGSTGGHMGGDRRGGGDRWGGGMLDERAAAFYLGCMVGWCKLN